MKDFIATDQDLKMSEQNGYLQSIVDVVDFAKEKPFATIWQVELHLRQKFSAMVAKNKSINCHVGKSYEKTKASMKNYTIEQEFDKSDKDYLKWFIWDGDGSCINENKPFDTQQQAEAWIPDYEADQASRAWERQQERLFEEGMTKAEMNERHHNEQKLK